MDKNKFLVVFKTSDGDRQDHLVNADGFDRTDFDILLWNKDMFGKKENVALYTIHEIVCITKVDQG